MKEILKVSLDIIKVIFEVIILGYDENSCIDKNKLVIE